MMFLLGFALAARTLAASESVPAPLFTDLGNYHHPVTTQSPLAQRYFDQGLILMYGFNHAEAIRSFQAATQVDPTCAMGYWGMACAYGPNINAPMADAAVPKAWQALQQALKTKAKVSPCEQAYIDALARRYASEPVQDRAPLDQAYADAMREVARQYPDDPDAATLFAEALMDTMPWDYWTADKQAKPATEEVLAALRAVLRRDPRHPGANHFYIHAVEASPNPELGIPSADRLGHFAPGAGHLVHMPSHIYLRVGDYEQASAMNVNAVRADERYISQCKAQGFYPGAYYPHSLHFLWYTRGLEGRSRECIATAKKVGRYAVEGRCGVIEGPRLRHLPLLALARFGHWEEILKTPAMTEYKFDTAMWHYARGLALAATGQPEAAAQEHERLVRLAALAEIQAMNSPYLPATGILKVADRVLAGKVAGARQDLEAALQRLNEAVQAEGELPYMEPPFWYFPVRQSLGATLLRAQRPAEAEQVFRTDLDQNPRNGWSLQGLAQCLEKQNQTAAAKQVRREFDLAWKNADVPLNLEWY